MSNDNTASRWYYRLGNSECHEFLWSGAISSLEKVTKAEIKRAICEREGLKRMPSDSVVVSATQMVQAKRGAVEAAAKARNAMNGVRRMPTPVALAPKVFADVADAPLTVEDVQAMLKKHGLA